MEEQIGNRKTGEDKAYEEVFLTYYPHLCLFANRILSDFAEAEDIVQDVFLRLWEMAPTLPEDTRLGNYLYSSVKNLCLNHLKHLQVEDSHKSKLTEALAFMGSLEYEDDTEVIDKLRACVGRLPEQQRKILEMRMFQDMSYKEIAERLKISEGSVHTHVKRAYNFIRAALPPELLKIVLPFVAFSCF